VHGNLRNMLILTDQSQRVSQPVSQITLSQFRNSHFADYPYSFATCSINRFSRVRVNTEKTTKDAKDS